MHDLSHWLATSQLSQEIQAALWLVPLLQTVHILGVAMVISSVAMIDLRLIGLPDSESMHYTGRRFLPWIWAGLGLLLATGLLQIIAEPRRTLDANPAFQLKLLLLLLAVSGTMAFQSSLARNIARWEAPGRRSTRLLLAAASFLLWCAILVAGRWIAYSQAE